MVVQHVVVSHNAPAISSDLHRIMSNDNQVASQMDCIAASTRQMLSFRLGHFHVPGGIGSWSSPSSSRRWQPSGRHQRERGTGVSCLPDSDSPEGGRGAHVQGLARREDPYRRRHEALDGVSVTLEALAQLLVLEAKRLGAA